MVSAENFKGVVVESWPIKTIKHTVRLPDDSAPVGYIPKGVLDNNAGLKADDQLLHYLRQGIERNDNLVRLVYDIELGFDAIECHTAEFEEKNGVEYARKHPNLNCRTVSNRSTFWRSVYLVKDGVKYPIIRTNWVVEQEYMLNRGLDAAPAGVKKQLFHNIARHPVLLPMGTGINAAFLWRATNDVIPVQNAFWPDWAEDAVSVESNFSHLSSRFWVRGVNTEFDLHVSLTELLGCRDYSQEHHTHQRIDRAGERLLKRIERIYNKPVFAIRGGAYSIWQYLTHFDNGIQCKMDTWDLVSRDGAEYFIPTIRADVINEPIAFGDVNNVVRFLEGCHIRYVNIESNKTKPSSRLSRLKSSTGLNWQDAVTTAIEGAQKKEVKV